MEGLTTQEMLETILEHFNQGRGVTFLTHSGHAPAVIQRLRMRLSRLRNRMDEKNLPKQHFRLEASHYPYTNRQGKRFDCIIFQQVKTQQHLVNETVERFLKNAHVQGNDGAESQPVEQFRPQFEW